MEIQRFDAIARRLGQDGTRRRLLGLFGGTALGGLMATTFGPEGEATRKKKKKKKSCKKKKCGECQVCQKGKCKPKPDDTPCSDGTCEGGVCIGISNCPSDQVCEEAGICCTPGIVCGGGACYCDNGEFPVCSCPAGDQVCQGTQTDSCCLPGDDCDESGVCVTGTCSAGNALCQAEFAYCGPTCACFTAADGSQTCGDISGVADLCPENSECTTNANCGGDVCVDVSCCAASGFVGLCVPPCAANRMGERAARRGARVKLPRLAARR
jgi:hypothetical protein